MSRPKKQIIVKSTHAEIPLKNGYFAIIDLQDVEKAKEFGWILDDTKDNWYVQTCTGTPRRTVRLHRFLLGVTKGLTVDHVDGNGLNNLRSNLRISTQTQNSRNRRKIKKKTSKYKGVHVRDNGKFRATIRVNRKLINIGTFTDEIEAAVAYNEYAKIYFGEFACLNQLP